MLGGVTLFVLARFGFADFQFVAGSFIRFGEHSNENGLTWISPTASRANWSGFPGLSSARKHISGAAHRARVPMRPLPIAMVVDVDPDWRSAGQSSGAYSGEMKWDGLRRGVPLLIDSLAELRDANGSPVRFTWLLRSDEQMASTYGDPAYIADEFGDFWRGRMEAGDEIGWHPHTWRYSEQERVWYQEHSDEDWVRRCLKEGFMALARRFPIQAAKAGWTYHDNQTMRAFAELGVKVDLSALPGMSHRGSVPGTRHPLGEYDWSRTPQEPYHPRPEDYQVPGDGHALPILEVPNWTYPVGVLRRLEHQVRGRSWRDFANPAKTPMLVGKAFRKPPYSVPFVCYFHPEELLSPSWMFGSKHVARNLASLLVACTTQGLLSRFVVASQLCGAA